MSGDSSQDSENGSTRSTIRGQWAVIIYRSLVFGLRSSVLGDTAASDWDCLENFFKSRSRGLEKSIPVLGMAAFEWVPLPLPNLWNHRVSGKSANNSWGSISCGQNLEPQGLRGPSRCSGSRRWAQTPTNRLNFRLAMICFLPACAQSQMSQRVPVENFEP